MEQLEHIKTARSPNGDLAVWGIIMAQTWSDRSSQDLVSRSAFAFSGHSHAGGSSQCGSKIDLADDAVGFALWLDAWAASDEDRRHAGIV